MLGSSGSKKAAIFVLIKEDMLQCIPDPNASLGLGHKGRIKRYYNRLQPAKIRILSLKLKAIIL